VGLGVAQPLQDQQALVVTERLEQVHIKHIAIMANS
jgi:hypothetical protein